MGRTASSFAKILCAATLVTTAVEPADAQFRGRYGRSSAPAIDPAMILPRLDANRDGMLSPGEIPEAARPVIERVAGHAQLNMSQPMPLDRLIEAVKQLRAARSGGQNSGSGGSQSSGSNASGADSPEVPGFGVEADLPEVPGFGPVAESDAIASGALEDRYERRVIDYVNGVFSRYDKNDNDVLDPEEWKDVRWRSDPKESDTNKDGRLNKAEFCERMVRHWKWGRKQPSSSTGSLNKPGGFKSGGGSSSSSSSGEREKVRRYAKSLLTRYDENKNGVLEKDEWSKMSGEPKQSDANGDDILTLEELTTKLANYGKGSSSSGSSSSGTVASRSSSSSKSRTYPASSRTTSGKPVYRFKSPTERLPRGLPDWFTRNDANGDGQIAMSEYSATWSNSKAEEFTKYDLNSDGFITPGEALSAEEDD
jgi:hypothetical protein